MFKASGEAPGVVMTAAVKEELSGLGLRKLRCRHTKVSTLLRFAGDAGAFRLLAGHGSWIAHIIQTTLGDEAGLGACAAVAGSLRCGAR